MAEPRPGGASAASVRGFWGMLTDQEQATLRASASSVRHYPGMDIVTEGSPSEDVAIIRSGWAKATVSKAGRPVLLRLYGPGDLVGVSAALSGTAPAETVTVANRELYLYRLSARRFTEFIRRAPHASTALLRVQQWRLEEADRLRAIRSYPTAAQRLAGLLCELCRPENHPSTRTNGSILVPGGLDISQRELGSWIGDSLKTVVRAIAELRSLELIKTFETGGGGVIITAPDRLGAFVEAVDADHSSR